MGGWGCGVLVGGLGVLGGGRVGVREEVEPRRLFLVAESAHRQEDVIRMDCARSLSRQIGPSTRIRPGINLSLLVAFIAKRRERY